jgi:DNA replication initiation complex subunit (GINS family)
LYNRLYRAWRKEKLESKDLQPMEPKFFAEMSQYVKKMREELRMLDEKTLRYRILSMELEKAQTLVSSIMQARLQKLIDLIFYDGNAPQAHLTSEEVVIFRNLLEVFEQYRLLRRRVLEGRSTEPSAKVSPQSGKILVRFTTKIPSVVGVDLQTYGPFEPEDIAALPRENAEALIRQKAAAKIEVDD